jgi:hypothetical protein
MGVSKLVSNGLKLVGQKPWLDAAVPSCEARPEFVNMLCLAPATSTDELQAETHLDLLFVPAPMHAPDSGDGDRCDVKLDPSQGRNEPEHGSQGGSKEPNRKGTAEMREIVGRRGK